MPQSDPPLTPLHELVNWRPETSDIEQQFQAYQQTGHPDQLKPLMKTLEPTITKAVKQYAPGASPIVHDRARLLAVKAIKGYQPSRNVPLHAHVYRQLQEIQRIAPKIQEPMAMPERLRRERGVLLGAINAAKDELGREPSDEEISERTGLPPAKVTKVRSLARASLPASAIEEAGDDDENDDVVAHQRSPEDDWTDAVYHDLSDPDRLILQHRTGYRGAPILPTQDIAKMLNISSAAISQRAARIQARLDEFHDPPG
jgi:DNA-directed RNA polymerase specialized sigma subunit